VVLGSGQPEGYTARSFFRSNWGWDWAGAQADVEKALALDAGNADTKRRYANLLASLGRLPEAIAAGKSAIELDPLNADSWQNLGNWLDATGNRAAAVEAIHRALEIQPGHNYATFWLAAMQLAEGQAAEALETFRKVDQEGSRLTGIAMAEFTLHHGNESRRALDEAITKFANVSAYQIADAYAWCGENDLAFRWLERAYQQHDGGLSMIKWDPLVVSLRGDPRYAALLRKMNLPEQTTARRDESPLPIGVLAIVHFIKSRGELDQIAVPQ
jgi:tetratricopeptide (TPR) repeat protein